MWLNMIKANFSWDIRGYVTLLTSFSKYRNVFNNAN